MTENVDATKKTEEQLTEALTRRNKQLGEEIWETSSRLLDRAGETSAAQLLSMHHAVNSIVNRVELKNPEDVANYVTALYEAMHSIESALETGVGTRERELKIADSSKRFQDKEGALAYEFKKAIEKVGGSAGSEMARGMNDTQLVDI